MERTSEAENMLEAHATTHPHRLPKYAYLTRAWVVYAAVASVAWFSRVQPYDASVRRVQSWVNDLGLLAIVFAAAIVVVKCVRRGQPAGARVWPGVLTSSLRGAMFYAAALWALGEWGDKAHGFLARHFAEMLVIVATGAIVVAIYRACATDLTAPAGDRDDALKGVVTVETAQQWSRRDDLYTAYHEAGHMLTYAALTKLPDDAKVAILPKGDPSGIAGYSTGRPNSHRIQDRTFAEWQMLLCLAGQVGELVAMGQTTLGSGDDLARWLRLAQRYLENHGRGIYYATPSNAAELQRNEYMLLHLQDEQRRLLRELFERNAGVHRELASALIERRELERADLAPYLQRVQVPLEFPRPSEASPVRAVEA